MVLGVLGSGFRVYIGSGFKVEGFLGHGLGPWFSGLMLQALYIDRSCGVDQERNAECSRCQRLFRW